jgi:hypothetical protein
MSRTRRFSPETLALMRRLRQGGLSWAGIGEVVGAPWTSVRRVIQEGYVRDDDPPTRPIKKRGPDQRGRPRRLSDADVRLVQKRRTEGFLIRQIAAELGAPESTVQRAAAGFPPDTRYQRKSCPTCLQSLPRGTTLSSG